MNHSTFFSSSYCFALHQPGPYTAMDFSSAAYKRAGVSGQPEVIRSPPPFSLKNCLILQLLQRTTRTIQDDADRMKTFLRICKEDKVLKKGNFLKIKNQDVYLMYSSKKILVAESARVKKNFFTQTFNTCWKILLTYI